MKFYHRAFFALRHYKRNTLLLFLIFAILFSLVLSGLLVRNASRATTRRMGIEIGGALQVEARSGGDDANRLSAESAGRIAAHPAVAKAEYSSRTPARAEKGMAAKFKDVPVREQNVTLLGANGAHDSLVADCRILEGRRPGPEDRGYAVLNEWLARTLSAAPGDTVKLAWDKAGTRALELTVLGVYYRDVGFHYGPPEEYVENTIYTDLETVAYIGGSDGLEGAFYTLYDPADMPDLLADVEAMELPERQDLMLVALDGDYQKIALAMESIVTVADLIFFAALLLGAILLIAMVMISLSSREFEIGVLLSMGEEKWKVILQLALESLTPVLLGVTAGVLISGRTAYLIAELLGAAKRGVQVSLEPGAEAVVYLCGVGLTALASLVTGYKVLRFQPKKLMMSLE